MTKKPSNGALQKADEFIDELIGYADVNGAFYAPCFRDDLADNKAWVRQKLALLFDEVADGRPFYTDE